MFFCLLPLCVPLLLHMSCSLKFHQSFASFLCSFNPDFLLLVASLSIFSHSLIFLVSVISCLVSCFVWTFLIHPAELSVFCFFWKFLSASLKADLFCFHPVFILTVRMWVLTLKTTIHIALTSTFSGTERWFIFLKSIGSTVTLFFFQRREKKH